MESLATTSVPQPVLDADFENKAATDMIHQATGGSLALNYAAKPRKSSLHKSQMSAPLLTALEREQQASKPNAPLKKKSVSVPVFVPTTTRDKVPPLFQEPHIETGFRELGLPWYRYVLSSFQLHNESMNVWTHFLAVCLTMYKLIGFSDKIDFIHDPYSWPLLSGFICGILLYAFSTGAHCMQSKSELFHYTSFMVDYAGIGLYGLGSVIVHISYCSEDVFYNAVNQWFIPLGCLMAFAICFCCTVSKVFYKRPYPFVRKLWQVLPVVGIYILLISPIAHRLFYCFVYKTDCNDSIPLHMQQIMWFILSGIFFTLDFPQRLRHGLCDHFFHGHQIFHICIMICTLKQMDAVYIDFLSRKDVVHSRELPSFFSAFGPVILTLVSEFLCIYVFRLGIIKKLEKEKMEKSH